MVADLEINHILLVKQAYRMQDPPIDNAYRYCEDLPRSWYVCESVRVEPELQWEYGGRAPSAEGRQSRKWD